MNTSLRPHLALLVHLRDDRDHYHVGRDVVLSLHGITHGPDKAPVLDAGRLLTPAEGMEIADRLRHPAAEAREVEFLDPSVLRSTPNSLTWFRAPAHTRLHWRTKDGHQVIQAVLPGLLFHVENGVLAVAAYAGSERPDARTPLYAAPLSNVFADTLVCVGNATLPTHCEASSREAWERVLLATKFTHINHPNTLAGGATTESLIAFWKRRTRYASSPDARLMHPLQVRALDWVKRLSTSAVER